MPFACFFGPSSLLFCLLSRPKQRGRVVVAQAVVFVLCRRRRPSRPDGGTQGAAAPCRTPSLLRDCVTLRDRRRPCPFDERPSPLFFPQIKKSFFFHFSLLFAKSSRKKSK
ncbi:hypothetical protein [Pandoravirus japonicus]|uniref:Uncharacterized protein n=1 Tax=Pandoravirus japonicus TaxID=2823154 RepID=A0A811BRT8_9VIRU|nr:hypothetical protein [Pandoravirus japonicus]